MLAPYHFELVRNWFGVSDFHNFLYIKGPSPGTKLSAIYSIKIRKCKDGLKDNAMNNYSFISKPSGL